MQSGLDADQKNKGFKKGFIDLKDPEHREQQIKTDLIERGKKMGLGGANHPGWEDTIKNMTAGDLKTVGEFAAAVRHLSDPTERAGAEQKIRSLLAQHANDPDALARLQTALQIATGNETIGFTRESTKDGTKVVFKVNGRSYTGG